MGQGVERPFPSLHLELLGNGELEEVTHCRGKHERVALVVIFDLL